MLVSALCVAAEPATGLTCEQLFAVAQTAVRYRDEGYTLDQVLSALKAVNAEGKLTAGELETLRRAVTLAYMGNASPNEIALECVRVQGTSKP